PDSHAGPTLTLASDCDALRALLPSAPALDPSSLIRVLTYGYCPAPHTMWSGVRKLGPGQRLHWKHSEPAPQLVSWWHPPQTLAPSATTDLDADTRLTNVCAEHLIGDVPVAMFLSAGIDSAAVALALHRSGADMSRITALTLSTGDSTDGGDESADAADLAHRLGMPHRVVPFAPADLRESVDLAARLYDEPQGYTALLTAARIAAATRAAVPDAKVVLSGDGGDEAFAGYAWHMPSTHPLALDAPLTPDDIEHARLAALVASPDARGRDRIAANLAWSHRSVLHRYARRLFDGFHPAEAAALVGAASTTLDDDLHAWLGDADRPSLPWPRRAQRLDILGFCPGSITPKLDRACMGVGLELRCPLLDRRVLDWSLARPIDPRERVAASSKPSLRDFLARGMRDGLVPNAILARPKRGFSLRLSDADAFEPLTAMIDASPLVASGTLRPDYQRFIPAHPETRQARLALLANLAAWHQHRS
ncbi:MAG: asparagine synthase C-terminal domain-containing protein, partial [Phycisphaerales bacterium]|nr:asparagine synthase C-terminal domain-containing protein [Phycisphaerales bacterium]